MELDDRIAAVIEVADKYAASVDAATPGGTLPGRFRCYGRAVTGLPVFG
jgi:hypothetical protein